MSKVGGTVLHVLHSLEPRPPSSSGHAIQNTWSVLAGSANNGLDEGEGGRRGDGSWEGKGFEFRSEDQKWPPPGPNNLASKVTNGTVNKVVTI